MGRLINVQYMQLSWGIEGNVLQNGTKGRVTFYKWGEGGHVLLNRSCVISSGPHPVNTEGSLIWEACMYRSLISCTTPPCFTFLWDRYKQPIVVQC